MQMEGGDRRFTHGQHKGQTYEEVSRKVVFVEWALLQPSIPDRTYNPRPRGKGQKKVPLNPPKDRCADCTDCSYAGNGPQGKFEDHAVSEKLLEATEQAVPIIQALTADDATADLNPEAVEQLMVLLQDRVSQAIALEECIHPAALHEWLRQAITTVMDQSPSSPSWGFVPTALVARGRSPGKRKGKGKGKGKAKAKGKPPAPEQQPGGTTAEPEFYQISDPLGADTFVGSQCPELDADYREAILLESFRTKSELHDPFPAAEDAQKELDEAFERAFQQIAANEAPDSITRLEYQARNPIHVPAVPRWHGPTEQDRDEENRAEADAWQRRRDAIL
ncbi:unnamed protein product [Symbiodinium sp. KB8]|nr:unnamed protein product [Symbiodinium sp. KB8]